MKVNDIIIDQILHVPGPAKHYDSGEDEDAGLFKKLFSKKEKEPKDTFYTSRIKEFGRDEATTLIRSTKRRSIQ